MTETEIVQLEADLLKQAKLTDKMWEKKNSAELNYRVAENSRKLLADKLARAREEIS